MSRTSDVNALNRLARALAALAARLASEDAAATAGVLVQAMSETTDAYARDQLAQCLPALGDRPRISRYSPLGVLSSLYCFLLRPLNLPPRRTGAARF